MLGKLSLVLPALFVFAVYNSTASAAAPVLKVTKSVTINAPASEVWDEVGEFDDIDDWHPAVAKAEIVKGENDQVGAVRLLTLADDGGTTKEQLLSHDDAGMSYSYKILESVLPVSNYKSTIKVEAAGKGASKATWSGSFQRKDLSDHPAKEANDKMATSTISSVYQAGLDNLKKQAETED